MSPDLQNSTPERRRMFAVRVDVPTPEVVEALARDLGCYRINGAGQLKGAIGVMLDRIARGALNVVPAEE